MGETIKAPKTLMEVIRYFSDPATCVHTPGTARKRSKQDSQVRPIVLAEVQKADTDPHIKENVEAGAPLYTDDGQHYRYLPDYAHEFIDHAEAYVRGSVHTNGIENFWSLLKRSLAGTYVSVEPFHLRPYVDEQAFRFNQRHTTDEDRFVQLCSMVANRGLTWNDLTEKTHGEHD
jgi:transposase-like protein